jgi:hypothetical protein
MHKRLSPISTFLAAIAVILIPSPAQGENAVIFTGADVLPGDEFTVDVIIENDGYIGAALVPFRWSSQYIQFLSVEPIEDRYEGTFLFFPTTAVTEEQRAGFIVQRGFEPGEEGWIAPGSGPIARINLRILPGAPTQIAFIDSVLIESGGVVIVQAQFTNLTGTVTILPTVYPGAITIGNPPAVRIAVSPPELYLRGELDGSDPVSGFSISTEGETDLNWLAEWNSLWLTVSPSIGKTPALPSVSASLFGLDLGSYFDTILIISPHAANNPVRVPVLLEVDSAGPAPADVGFTLLQNRPNPFVTYHDPETQIDFILDEPARVTISIYDVLGRRIVGNLNVNTQIMPDGLHSVVWDGRDDESRRVASGNYFYRMSTDRGSETRRMILIN